MHLTEVITDWIGKIASFLMVAIIGYMIVSATIRYVFHGAINYLGIVPNIFFVYVCLGAAYAYNQKAFMVVDIFYRRFSPRVRAVIDLGTSVMFFIFTAVLIQVSSRFVLPALANFKFDPGMLIAPDRWPITIIFPLGPILILIAGTVRVIRNILILIYGEREVIAEKGKFGAEGLEEVK